ncbi:MAG: malate synthase A [Candidatus Pacebacteria bacterium]|nr:malate synthase A [Candidatus Paceibacterota bacterium]
MSTDPRVVVTPFPRSAHADILTPEALAFLADLERHFGAERHRLMAVREERQLQLDKGWKPDFLPETADIRAGDWKCAPIPPDIQDRKVEITGPVDRKMIINALNSGARVFMADFEDSNTPTWPNQLDGQVNLFDAVRRTITFTDEKSGKWYELNENPAVLFVRPRGWHLTERHVFVDGVPMSGSLFDFGLFFFHNAKELIKRGTGPYFYLPKMESHMEARLWNEVFIYAQKQLGIPVGTIRATALIETVLAAFEMDEILYELRDHSAGLNCGRWDYIFSFIKKFRNDPKAVMPDRSTITMGTHFLKSYSLLLIKTCHRRGVHAMGGMAAQIPIKGDPVANGAAMKKIRADKKREATNGHDGTWVAHPGMVEIAMEELEAVFTGPNQISKQLPEVQVTAADLLKIPEGEITEAGLKQNLNVGVCYLEAWLRGIGCVPLHHLMEDAATAEISRTQVWQWRNHKARLSDGRLIDMKLIRSLVEEDMRLIETALGKQAFAESQFKQAAKLFLALVENAVLTDFLTVPAYVMVA